MKIKLEKDNNFWGYLTRATREQKKYLRNLKVFWVICGFLMLVSSVWPEELEDLKKGISQLEKTQKKIPPK
ncbi:MAG: hypothetical protein V3W17_03650 [Desulfobacteria bacterium]